MIERLDQKTPNFTDEHIAKIAGMFPHCVVEAEDESGKLIKAIDFDLLRQELAENIVDGPKERYRLDWPGKRASLVAANTPITKTLRPAREESVDFDTTQNLYIEGDNLDALKLLQKSYLGAVKMIYIDPPYNTGKDFVYKDNFSRSREEELKESGQIDEEGGRLVANLESNGRFHSDWLSMMYPRLRLARNLLRDDGVIFISIDDNEVHNLRKICDEVFGEQNFIAQIIWLKGKEGGNDNSGMGEHHEYILMYGRNAKNIQIKLDPKDTSRHITTLPEENLVIEPEYLYKEGEPFQLINLSKQKDYKLKIPLKDGTVLEWEGYCPQSTLDEYIKMGKVFVGQRKVPYIKSFLSDEKTGTKPSTIFEQTIGTTKSGGIEIKNLFGYKIFSYPKPSTLIYRLLQIIVEKNDIIMDFFSGSAPVAQAVIQYNIDNNASNKFILIQINEELNVSKAKTEKEKKVIEKAIEVLQELKRPLFITEIGKERIRRAGRKIKEENADKEGIEKLDIGFRVLKIDSSNMKDVYFTPDKADRQSLFDTVDHIKEDRTAEDLLFGVLVDWGVDLTLPIRRESIEGKTVYFVGKDALAACFDDNLDETFLKALAEREVLRVVFKESGFRDDAAKINAEQIFAQLAPGTDVRVI